MPFLKTVTSRDEDGSSKRDLLAMLAMLDYLIAQTRVVDVISAHCLVLARKSLEDTAARCVGPH